MTPVHLAHLQALLHSFATHAPQLAIAGGAGRAYELLVMLELAAEMKNSSWNVDVFDSEEKPLLNSGKFIQRAGKPSGIWPKSWGNQGPAYIRFRVPNGTWWEIWNGVQFIGRSKALHEVDISVVPHELGLKMRALTTSASPTGHGLVSIECKEVATAGSLDEMRAFVARIYDTTLLRAHTNNWKPKHHRIYLKNGAGFGFGSGSLSFFDDNTRSFGAVVRATGFAQGSSALASGYLVAQYPDVKLSSSQLSTFVHDVVAWISANVAKY